MTYVKTYFTFFDGGIGSELQMHGGAGIRIFLNDQCPNTPAGVQVDMMGCALDGDGDEYQAEVEKVAMFLKKYGAVRSRAGLKNLTLALSSC